jgi:hypothetical protein
MMDWSSAELDVLIEEITVDAYGDGEQLSSFEMAFDELSYPIAGVALGQAVEVAFDGDDRRGLEAVVRIDDRRHRLALLDVSLDTHDIEACRLLEAYCKWWSPGR